MTLAYPDAADSAEAILDGVHAVVGEDWDELAAALETLASIIGQLGFNWSNRVNLAEILAGARKIDCGWVYTASSNFRTAVGVSISFDSGHFDTAGAIAVTAGISEFNSDFPDVDASQDNPERPVCCGATVASTTSATLYGLRPSGVEIGSGITDNVRVGWHAAQIRAVPSGGPAATFTPDGIPQITSVYEVDPALPNTIAAQIEGLTAGLGAPLNLGSWTTIAKMLDGTEIGVTGFVRAAANQFQPGAGGDGVVVTVDRLALFPDLTDVVAHAFLVHTGPEAIPDVATAIPMTFACLQIQTVPGDSERAQFVLRGYRRDGGAITDTTEISVGWMFRRRVPAPS